MGELLSRTGAGARLSIATLAVLAAIATGWLMATPSLAAPILSPAASTPSPAASISSLAAAKPHVHARCSASSTGAASSPERRATQLIGPGESIPRELSGEPDPSALSQFEVLRRAATPEDRPPPINELASELGFELSSYYPSSIREVLKTAAGDRYFALLGFRGGVSVPPARCLPPALRHERAKLIRELQEEEKVPVYCTAEVAVQHSREANGPSTGILSPPGANEGSECLSLPEIESGLGLMESDMSSVPVVELVPDGVATVRLTYRDGTTIDASVSNNAFSFTPPQGPIRRARALIHNFFLRTLLPLANKHLSARERRRLHRRLKSLQGKFIRTLRSLPPRQEQWLDAGGNVLRTISPHTPSGSGGGVIVFG